MVYVASFTFPAVVVSSKLPLAVSNGMCNKFHFSSCCCEQYVNSSCELMWLLFYIEKYRCVYFHDYVIVIGPF